MSEPFKYVDHVPTKAEKESIDSGSDTLGKLLLLDAYKAELEPATTSPRGISATTRVKLDDGTGDFLKLSTSMGPAIFEQYSKGAALDADEFADQVIAPAAEKNLGGLGLSPTMVYPAPDLHMPPLFGKDMQLDNRYCGVNAIRENELGQTPPGEAITVAGILSSWTRPIGSFPPSKESLMEDLHKVSERLSKDSAPFNMEFGEAIENMNRMKMYPETKLLPGSVIKVSLTDESGKKTAEITAYPDKPTEYKQL